MNRLTILSICFGSVLILAFWVQSSSPSSRVLTDVSKTQSFSEGQLDQGAVVLYFIGIIYTLACIQVVASGYLSPIIDVVINKYDLNPDVAGATLQGFSGSAPELCISFLGTIFADSDVGVGNILGSGALNAMFLTGLCAILAKSNLELHWWPLARDFIFNSIMLAVLAEALYDRVVHWFEGLFLFLVYILYASFMFFNDPIERLTKKSLNLPYEGDQKEYHPLPERVFIIRRRSVTDLEPYLPKSISATSGVIAKIARNTYITVKNSAEESPAPIVRRFKRIGLIVLRALEELKRCEIRQREARGLYHPYPNETDTTDNSNEDIEMLKLANIHRSTRIMTAVTGSRPLIARIRVWIMWPVIFATKHTIPMSQRLWVIGGLLSICWIAGFCYLAMWWCHIIAMNFSINDSLLGMVFLAPGTTFPDLFNTVQATMQGKGDMALSSSVSSNILNISMGLGLPWFIYGLIWGNFSVSSGSLFVATCIQIGMVFVSFLFIGGFKWQLSASLGKVMFLFYLIYLVSYLLLETLVYGKS